MATKTIRAEFLKGLWDENPVFRQLLGLCPTLAVTGTVITGLAMGLATTFVLILSSLVVSSIKRLIPAQVRIATYIVVIASFSAISVPPCGQFRSVVSVTLAQTKRIVKLKVAYYLIKLLGSRQKKAPRPRRGAGGS